MKTTLRRIVNVAIGVVWLGLAGPLSAQTTLFDNTALLSDKHTRFNPGTYQVGDEIILAGIGKLTYFSFEFWGTNTASPGNLTFAGAITADVRIYYNTGTPYHGYATPGASPIWDSGSFSVGSPTPRSTFIFTEGSDNIPIGGLPITSPDITWTVQFQGMGATDSVGLDIYSPPVVGSDYPDYWQNDGTGWTLQTNTIPMNFGALMQTPEPSSITLSLLGGLGILLAMRWSRRNK